MKECLKKQIDQMTLEEKLQMIQGKGFWVTCDIKRLGIPSFHVSDGPCGVRKQVGHKDHMGINESVKATAFTCGSGMGSCWNRELLYETGQVLGQECIEFDVDMLLGPAINIKRQPLNGRNFEYYSEDPYLTAQMADAYIEGIQSQGIGACIKHFAANNQEHNRNCVDTIIDERTLREIYLYAFEYVVKNSNPLGLMTAYNKVNGAYCAHNTHLLKDILREEWGYENLLISDWGGTYDAGTAHRAGLDLEMPYGGPASVESVKRAMDQGGLTETMIDEAVAHVIDFAQWAQKQRIQRTAQLVDWAAHQDVARRLVIESTVLLKNEDNLLPLKQTKRIALIGSLAKNDGSLVSGSAVVNAHDPTNCLDELKKLADKDIVITYADEYGEDAALTAAAADAAVLFVGVRDGEDAEGKDRSDVYLRPEHLAMIKACSRVQKNIVVVLLCGGVVDLSWMNDVKAVLHMHLPGQAAGIACAQMLLGIENPSGKLSETYPVHLENNPAYLEYPDVDKSVTYSEGIFVGYRYYDTCKLDVAYPFGHGLSYTTFEYRDMEMDKDVYRDDEKVCVAFKVKNTGQCYGKETVQLYVRDVKFSVRKPYKELKGFEKIGLAPGEEKTVTIMLDKSSFAHYDVKYRGWTVEGGAFEILVGSSSRDIRLVKTIQVHPRHPHPFEYTKTTSMKDIFENEICGAMIRHIMEALLPKIMFFGDEMPLDRKCFFLMMSNLEMMQRFNPDILTEAVVDEILYKANHPYEFLTI